MDPVRKQRLSRAITEVIAWATPEAGDSDVLELLLIQLQGAAAAVDSHMKRNF
jgi:hypothetical protein